MAAAKHSEDILVYDLVVSRKQSWTKVTPERWERFLASMADMPNVTRACRNAGISRQEAYREKHANPDFAVRWEDAYQAGVDALEEACMERVADKQSDLLTIFVLKAHRPHLYSEKAQQESGTKNVLEIHHHYPSSSVEDTTIEVESRAVTPDVNQLSGSDHFAIDVSTRKD